MNYDEPLPLQFTENIAAITNNLLATAYTVVDESQNSNLAADIALLVLLQAYALAPGQTQFIGWLIEIEHILFCVEAGSSFE